MLCSHSNRKASGARRAMRGLAAPLLAAALPAIAHAAVSQTVTLSTSQLSGHPSAPFTLDFQLIDGSGTGDANNSATITNIVLGGGSAVGSPTLTGGATGTLSSGVHLTDSAEFNDFTQTFTPGSAVSFMVSLSGANDAGDFADSFNFAILDRSGIELPTLDPSGNDAFATAQLTSTGSSLVGFGSDPSTPPNGGGAPLTIAAPQITGTSAVPLPSAASMVGIWGTLAGLGTLAVRRRMQAAI